MTAINVERREYIARRKAEGISLRQIADELGCSYGTVHQIDRRVRMAAVRTEYLTQHDGLACATETPTHNLEAIDLSCDRLLNGRVYSLGLQDVTTLEFILNKYLNQATARKVALNGSRNPS